MWLWLTQFKDLDANVVSKIQLQIWLCLILAFRTCLGWFCTKRCGYANNDFRSVSTDDEVHEGRKTMNVGILIATFKGHSCRSLRGCSGNRKRETTEQHICWASVKVHALLTKGHVTRDDSQRRFLAQRSVAMLELCCDYSKQCRNNVATLCWAKNRRCESSRVTSP